MFTKKEIVWIILAIGVMEFVIFFPDIENQTPLGIIVPIIVVLVSIMSKKIAANFFNLKIEHKCWEFQRYGVYERSKIKIPIPLGIIAPFFLSVLSLGSIKCFTLLQFEPQNLERRRMLKLLGINRRTEMNESDIAFTSAWGFYSLIALSIIGMVLGIKELAKFSIIYGAWNLIPFSKLDGNRVLFGTPIQWLILFFLYVFFLAVVIVLL